MVYLTDELAPERPTDQPAYRDAAHTGMVYLLHRLDEHGREIVGVFATLSDLEQHLEVEVMAYPTMDIYASEAVAFYGNPATIIPADGQAVRS